jgi:amino-acid N-acetyltransferase
MLGVTFRLRAGHPQDAPRVLALLSAAGLPISDLVPNDLLRFIVAQDAAVHTGGIVIGAVGLEAHGEAGLLRSLVVDPGWQGTGVGSALVSAIEHDARGLRLTSLALLTQTASVFFAARGYRAIARDAAPESLHSSTEFSTLCPASSVCMHKTLTSTNAIDP